MSDNINSQNQIDNNVDANANWAGVSGEAHWNDSDNANSSNSSNSSNTFDNQSNNQTHQQFANQGNIQSNNQIDNQFNNHSPLDVSDVTEDYPALPTQQSAQSVNQSKHSNAVTDNNHQNNNQLNNQIDNQNSNQTDNQNSNQIDNQNNQIDNQNSNQTNGQASQASQPIEIAPYTPEDINKANTNEQEQEPVESMLPTKQDDASLKNQVKNSTSPGGKFSLRIAGALVIAVIGTFIYLGVESSDPKSKVEVKANTKSLPVKDLKSDLKSNFSSPDMGTCPEPVTANMPKEPLPVPIEPPPPVIINTPPAPPPIQIASPSPEPVIIQEVEKPRQFAFRMRAGDQTVKSYEQAEKLAAAKQLVTTNTTTTNKVKIPRGTTIPLMMLQPFRNDIPTTVKCQITTDIKTSKGEVLIPAGAVAFVPFSPFRNDKRVFNQIDRPATISIAEDQEIQLSGTALDKSGGIGIQGKLVKRGDANVGRRIGRTMARVLTFGAASAAGGIGGGVIAEAGSSAIEGSYYYTAPTDSYVEVPLGTIFFFNVTSN